MTKWMRNLPLWAKIVFALPFLDIVWGINRIVRSVEQKNTLALVIAIIMIVVGIFFWWIVDIIFIVLQGDILWFKD